MVEQALSFTSMESSSCPQVGIKLDSLNPSTLHPEVRAQRGRIDQAVFGPMNHLNILHLDRHPGQVRGKAQAPIDRFLVTDAELLPSCLPESLRATLRFTTICDTVHRVVCNGKF